MSNRDDTRMQAAATQARPGGNKLTPPQRRLLDHADRSWRTGGELAERMHHAGSPEGLHQTAASLVRRGYLAKTRLHGTVCYQLTDRGAERARAERSPAVAR